jgi:hypothetical protein
MFRNIKSAAGVLFALVALTTQPAHAAAPTIVSTSAASSALTILFSRSNLSYCVPRIFPTSSGVTAEACAPNRAVT